MLKLHKEFANFCGLDSKGMTGLPGELVSIKAMCYNQTLYTIDMKGTVKSWHDDTNRFRYISEGATNICCSDSGYHISSYNGEVRSYAKDGTLVAVLPKNSSTPISCMAVSPNGYLLAAGSTDNKLFVWDTRTKTLMWEYPCASTCPPRAIAFSPNNKFLCCSWGDRLRTYQVDRWGVMRYEDLHVSTGSPDVSDVQALSYSPDSKYLAVAKDETVSVYEVQDNCTYKSMNMNLVPGSYITFLSFSPNGKYLVYSTSKCLYLQEVRSSGSSLTTGKLFKRDMIVCRACFSSDSKWLYTSSHEGAITMWEFDPMEQVAPVGTKTADTLKAELKTLQDQRQKLDEQIGNLEKELEECLKKENEPVTITRKEWQRLQDLLGKQKTN